MYKSTRHTAWKHSTESLWSSMSSSKSIMALLLRQVPVIDLLTLSLTHIQQNALNSSRRLVFVIIVNLYKVYKFINAENSPIILYNENDLFNTKHPFTYKIYNHIYLKSNIQCTKRYEFNGLYNKCIYNN